MTFNYFGELKKCIKKCYETKDKDKDKDKDKEDKETKDKDKDKDKETEDKEDKEDKEINRCKSLCFYRYSQGVNKLPYTPSGYYPSSY